MSLSAGSRKLDLYDFFSVLLPGSAFLLAMVPFLPNDFNVLSGAFVILLILGGFVVGRAIHALAVEIEASIESYPTHRERFYTEITQGENLHPVTVARFLDACESAFDIDDIGVYLGYQETPTLPFGVRVLLTIARYLFDIGPIRAKRDGPESDLYSLVRSYIHIDGRGRSRTFQAIYSFYRSMWIVSILIAIVYYGYVVLKFRGSLTDVVGFTSKIGASQVDLGIIALSAVGLAILAHFLFSTTRAEFQRYFVQYLITDFIVLESSNDYNFLLAPSENS